MVMYQPIIFGCKKISSSADMVETVIFDQMSPNYDPKRDDSKSIFLHDTLAHNVASPSLVTEGSAAEEISSRWTFTGILNLFCDLDLDYNRAIQSFHKTIHLMIMCHQTKFSCKRISGSVNILKSHILITLSLTVTLTLKTANRSFWKTIWLKMVHHHASLVVKKVQWFRRYYPDKHSLTFWNFVVTLTLNTTIQFLHKTR